CEVHTPLTTDSPSLPPFFLLLLFPLLFLLSPFAVSAAPRTCIRLLSVPPSSSFCSLSSPRHPTTFPPALFFFLSFFPFLLSVSLFSPFSTDPDPVPCFGVPEPLFRGYPLPQSTPRVLLLLLFLPHQPRSCTVSLSSLSPPIPSPCFFFPAS